MIHHLPFESGLIVHIPHLPSDITFSPSSGDSEPSAMSVWPTNMFCELRSLKRNEEDEDGDVLMGWFFSVLIVD